jgi:hypothetical protein
VALSFLPAVKRLIEMNTNKRPSLYLIGPIYGCSKGEANDWRGWVAEQLPGVNCISPLRCEPLVGQTYDLHYEDPCFGQPKSILAKNFFDLRQCDMALAYFPKPSEVEDLDGVIEWMESRGSDFDDPEHIAALKRVAKKGLLRSVGSIGEVSWAYALRKPSIIVSDDPLIHQHPFTSVQPDWPVLPDLDHAIRLIKGLWTGYTA